MNQCSPEEIQVFKNAVWQAVGGFAAFFIIGIIARSVYDWCKRSKK